MSSLEIRSLSLSFGGLKAIDGLDLTLPPRTIVGLIGPNGAGKSTVFNCISGFYKPDSGSIQFDGVNLVEMAPERLIELGIARTFQNLELFSGLTMLENLFVGQHHRLRYSLLDAALRTRRFRHLEQAAREQSAEVLERLGISQFLHACPTSLPYGIQKLVELARALVSRPRLLLLDEPAAGLTPPEKRRLAETVAWLREEWGLSIILVEHDMSFVMPLCDRVCVMNFGRKIAEGTPQEVRDDPEVIRAYLGGDD